tara:strand:- start:228 stop:443 length:216 start_codon:yes stop_codon:yes gene_type:complete
MDDETFGQSLFEREAFEKNIVSKILQKKSKAQQSRRKKFSDVLKSLNNNMLQGSAQSIPSIFNNYNSFDKR